MKTENRLKAVSLQVSPAVAVRKPPKGKEWLASIRPNGVPCVVYKDDLVTKAIGADLQEFKAVGKLIVLVSALPSGFALIGRLCLVKDGSLIKDIPPRLFEAECELNNFQFHVNDCVLLEEIEGEDESPIFSERFKRLEEIAFFINKSNAEGKEILFVTPNMANEPEAVKLLLLGAKQRGATVYFRKNAPFDEGECLYIKQ
jgi:hypothetical protein